MSYTVTKLYRDLPAAHRQHNHDGHCRFVHGHNWGFDITLGCTELDSNGFVVDVGKLGAVKAFLNFWFDHTLLINDDDPCKALFVKMISSPLNNCWDVRIVPNCGMEKLAEFVFCAVSSLLRESMMPTAGVHEAGRGLHVIQVVCHEDSKNSATYRP